MRGRDQNILIATTMLVIVLVDQSSKYWVIEKMGLRSIGKIEVSHFLEFRMAWNRGINFGLFSNDSSWAVYVLIFLLSGITACFIYAAYRSVILKNVIGLSIAAGGALSNIFDRVNYGAVADFINLSCCGFESPWSFNVADVAIFIGIGLLIWPTSKNQQNEATSS